MYVVYKKKGFFSCHDLQDKDRPTESTQECVGKFFINLLKNHKDTNCQINVD